MRAIIFVVGLCLVHAGQAKSRDDKDDIAKYAKDLSSQFKLTEQAIAALKKAKVTDPVLTKLKPVKDKELSQDEMMRETAKILTADETRYFQDLILKHSEQPPKSEKTRVNALQELGKHGKKASPALRVICDCTIDPSRKISLPALEALEAIDPDLYKPVSGFVLSKKDEQINYVRDLWRLKEKAKPALGILGRYLDSELEAYRNPRTRSGKSLENVGTTLEALWYLGADDQLSICRYKTLAGTSSPTQEIRLSALEHLVNWAGVDADRRKELIPLLRAGLRGSETDDRPVILACMAHAASLGTDAKDLVPTIKEFKFSQDAGLRGKAAGTISAIEK